MEFIVYSKENCPFCYKVKKVLELCNKDFIVYTLDSDFTKEEFYSKFGTGSTFPQVVYDNKKIGGCSDTVTYLRDMAVIS